MSIQASALNMAEIVKGRDQHNRDCPFPASEVALHPFNIDRMGWEEGDNIAGLRVVADPKLGTGSFAILCAGDGSKETLTAEDVDYLHDQERRTIETPDKVMV